MLSLQEGKQKEAEDLYSSALKMASNAQDIEDVFVIKLKLATIAFSMKKYKEAETFFTEVKDYLLKKGTNLDDLQLLYIDLRLAEIYDSLRNYELVLFVATIF